MAQPKSITDIKNLETKVSDTTNKLNEQTTRVDVLSNKALKYIGVVTTFSEVNETGYYTVAGCLDGTIPIQYGTLKAYLSGSEKTIETVGFKDNKTIQCHASYNNNTKQWVWEQSATKNEINEVSNQKFIRSDANTEGRDTPTKPSEYTLGLFTNQIKTFASMGIQGGGFAHVIGVNEWTDTTAGVHELMFAGTKMYHRESISPDVWGQLHELATTTKTDISFPYASNYNDFGTTDASTVTKVNNQVIVTMNTCKKDGESFTSGEIIGTLPVGYRPTSHTRSSGMSTNSVPILIEVFTTGNIRIKHAGATNITQVTGEVIFYV